MKKITVYYKSRSQPNTKYKAERHRNGNVTCFCPGAIYSGDCWHKKQLRGMPQK